MKRRELDVVCGGELLCDFFEVRPGHYRRFVGGASANGAIALARHGVKVALVANVGDDALGEALSAAVAREGVDVRARQTPGLPTGIVIKTAGRFSPYRSDPPVVADGVRATWLLVGSMLPEVRGVDANDVAVDLNVRPRLWKSKKAMQARANALVRGASLVKASDNDLTRLWGSEDAGLAWLAKRAPRAIVIVTRAEKPATAIGPWGEIHAPAHKATVRETTGAGDAFLAAVISVLLEAGEAWQSAEVLTRALRMGHRWGKRAVSRMGATPRSAR